MLAFDDNAGHEAEEAEENYFVSMTDMMVGILFIFIIMLMVFALQFQQQTDTSETQIEEVLKRVEEVAKQLKVLRDEIDSELVSLSQSQRERTQLLNDLKNELKAVGLEVQIDPENGVLRLTDNAIRFGNNRSDLDPIARANVVKLAQVLQRVLPKYVSSCDGREAPECIGMRRSTATIDTVFIEGHTDTVGTDERNWVLSTERAVSTYREITTVQPGLRHLKNRGEKEILSVSGYSSTRPIPETTGEAETDDARSDRLAGNRRIDMRFVMEVDNSVRLNEVLKLTDAMEEQIKILRSEVTPR
ncbi:OmpA family protein [Hoeflea sp.]|uniref:OmpA family protein n=1 Tax=Hoeflea sp. TaxID=1940281 RepID=UPI003A90979B